MNVAEESSVFNIPSPLEQLKSELFSTKKIEVYVKRDDLIHPVVSGNKWRKLKLNLLKAKQGHFEKIVTFGGAYSNHIVATAEACKQSNLPCIGVIRGEDPKTRSHTLQLAEQAGMQLHFVSRLDYNDKDEEYYKQELRDTFGNVFIIPEGGANFYGAQGCTEIVKELPFKPHYIFTASGTGTTAAGLVSGAIGSQTKVVSIPVLKSEPSYITNEIKRLLYYSFVDEDLVNDCLEQLIVDTDYHFGGYAKINSTLVEFCNTMYEQFKLPLDLVYTSKMMFGFCEWVHQDKIPPNSKVVLLHTGGLQGNRGFTENKKAVLNY